MNLSRVFLYFFSLIYQSLTAFRNYLYDKGYKKSQKFDVKLISVGNLTVGGTGKTPHIEYLIGMLKPKTKIATLSRGYGRKSKGFILADEKSSAELIGDEPMQFYIKFVKEITVTVGEKRIEAIPKILAEKPETQIILLDDAFQHRSVIPHINILLNDYHRPFYKDYLLPAGRLRESRKGAARADLVIVSKCPPNLENSEKQEILTNISKYTRESTSVFFTGIRYGTPKSVFGTINFASIDKGKSLSVILFSGIAKATLLTEYVAQQFTLIDHYHFSDHYYYERKDILMLRDAFDAEKSHHKILLTTEKDYTKLANPEFERILDKIPVFYLPIEICFLENADKFEKIILDTLST